MRIAVFASGNGQNFEELVLASRRGELAATIACLICDRAQAFVIKRAELLDIPCYVIEPRHFASKSEYEKQVLYYMQTQAIEFIVLAGYMRLVGSTLLRPFQNKIVNLHPSLLPEFVGKDSIERAYHANVSHSGITIHYIDAGMDTGPILFQKKVPLHKTDTLEQFAQRIHQVEHRYYATVINQIVKGEHSL